MHGFFIQIYMIGDIPYDFIDPRIVVGRDPGQARHVRMQRDAGIEQRTREILREVFMRGDDAVLEFTEMFDGAKLSADQLAVTQAEFFNASLLADESLRAAVAEAEANIAGFAKKSKRKDWCGKNSHGAAFGEKFDPFQRVGIYIPGSARR